MVVYTLYHEYEPKPGVDEVKLIGIYSSREKAEEALENIRDKPGFRDHPDDFNIYEVLLDRTGWTEGFGAA